MNIMGEETETEKKIRLLEQKVSSLEKEKAELVGVALEVRRVADEAIKIIKNGTEHVGWAGVQTCAGEAIIKKFEEALSKLGGRKCKE